jgi:hypothetical protein
MFIITWAYGRQGGMSDAAPRPEDFASAFEAAFAQLQVRIESACVGEAEWGARVAAAIHRALAWAADEPAAAQVLTNEALAGGREGFARYERMIAYLAGLLSPGRAEAAHGQRLPEITERAMASGVVMIVAQRLSMGREGELPGLAGEATQFVLTPFLGPAEARRVAGQPG